MIYFWGEVNLQLGKMNRNLGLRSAVAICAFFSFVDAQVTRILPLGDSITYGCGSSQALPPSWTVSCGPTAGGYRTGLYHALRDTGFVDAAGNATFTMVGTQFNGPTDIPFEQTANEGHPGWTIPQVRGSVPPLPN